MQSKLADLETAALPVRLNSMAEADSILRALEEASPLQDPVNRNVWVTRRLIAHMWEKIGEDGTYRARMVRMAWLRPSIARPVEMRENRDNRPGRVYLGCFKGFDVLDLNRCQFLAVIVKNEVFRGEDAVITMYPFRRAKEVEVMRRARLLWP